jgi:hypothetical protein
MAFDINNPVELQELNDEVFIDPIGMNYASAPIEKTKELLKFLNDPDKNVGGETAGNATFTHEVLMETWSPKGALNEIVPWIEALTEEQGNIEQYEAKYRADCGPDSLAALNAISQPLSRAEVLWGQDTVITQDDWFAARDI